MNGRDRGLCPANVPIMSGGLVLLVALAAGCTSLLPVYVETDVPSSFADSLTSNTTDSMRVTVASTVTAKVFSPFGANYVNDQEGAFGVRIPIQKVLGGLVEKYARRRFDRLGDVARPAPDTGFAVQRAIEPDTVEVDTAGGLDPLHLVLVLEDFRIKEHTLSSVADSTTGSGAEANTLIRGARMRVRATLRRGSGQQTAGIQVAAEKPFRSVKDAAWRPVLNALNRKMIVELDQFLSSQNL